jgi:hypothetical protein
MKPHQLSFPGQSTFKSLSFRLECVLCRKSFWLVGKEIEFMPKIANHDNPIFPARSDHENESTQINTGGSMGGRGGGRTSLSYLIISVLIPSAGIQRGGKPTLLLHY